LYVETFNACATELQVSVGCTIYEPVHNGAALVVVVAGVVAVEFKA
jgi:hypothetical protein